jgi:hypothetical protein
MRVRIARAFHSVRSRRALGAGAGRPCVLTGIRHAVLRSRKAQPSAGLAQILDGIGRDDHLTSPPSG